MIEPYRKMVYLALLGPIDGILSPDGEARHILEDVAARDLEQIEPIIDSMVADLTRELVLELEYTARQIRGQLYAMRTGNYALEKHNLTLWLNRVLAAIGKVK